MIDILTLDWTCMGCPMQAEGTLTDGRWFYFRYRWGRATFGIGDLIDAAIGDPKTVGLDYGDELQGVLGASESEELLQRLMLMRLATEVAS